MKKTLALIVLSLSLVSCLKKGAKSKTGFYVNLGGEPTTINPITSTDYYASELHNYVLDTLLTRSSETYDWEPRLAEKWEVSKDKMEFTFYLRKNAKFHDGSELTADDVKFTFDVIFDPDYNTAHLRPYYEGIKEAKVINKHTIKFIAKSTYYKNFDQVAVLQVLPKKFYGNKKNKKQFNKKIIGSGPYKLTKYNKGKSFIMTRNKDWYGFQDEKLKKEYNFKKMIWRFINDKNVSLEMLKKGKLDYETVRADAYMKKMDTKEFTSGKVNKVAYNNKYPLGYSYIGWNLKHPILKSRKVRKALYHLVNRDLMIEKFEYGKSVKAVGPVYPSSPYVVKDRKPVEFDPKKANKLLKEEGWSDTDGDGILDKVIDGKKTDFKITILEPWKGFEKYLTVIKEDAKKQGIEYEIKIMEWSSFIKLVREKKFEAYRMAWTSAVDWDPKQIWHSNSINGGSNYISYNNKQVDKLTDAARLIHDRAKRIKMLHKAQKMIIDDAPYVWFTYKPERYYGVNSRIQRDKDTLVYDIGIPTWKMKPTAKAK